MKNLVVAILLIVISGIALADSDYPALDQDERLEKNLKIIMIGLVVLSIGLIAGNIAFVAGEPIPGIAILFVSLSIGSIFAMMTVE